MSRPSKPKERRSSAMMCVSLPCCHSQMQLTADSTGAAIKRSDQLEFLAGRLCRASGYQIHISVIITNEGMY